MHCTLYLIPYTVYLKLDPVPRTLYPALEKSNPHNLPVLFSLEAPPQALEKPPWSPRSPGRNQNPYNLVCFSTSRLSLSPWRSPNPKNSTSCSASRLSPSLWRSPNHYNSAGFSASRFSPRPERSQNPNIVLRFSASLLSPRPWRSQNL